ncbi:MAG: hypothetical protein QNK17_03890, partial [Hyphomicrobiaceae bacterium]|nr:hypothetical protein [Hyphomicrobiaceae bacterium]MDX2449559.1 hypothetical protein [Hyphomicrobiaceae bacterium]
MQRQIAVPIFAVVAGALLLAPITTVAQDASLAAGADQSSSGAEILRSAAKAGLGGPQSVGPQLQEDAAQRKTMSRRPGVDAIFQPAEDSLER